VSFFFLFSVNTLLPFVLSVNADAGIPENNLVQPQQYTWEWAHIDNTWLDVQVSPFHDNSPGDGSGSFHMSKGGYDLKSFRNEGLISCVNNIVIYRASAVFSFELNFYTTAGIFDCFPNANLDKMESVKYVTILKYDGNWNLVNAERLPYSIDYRTVEFGNTFLKHDYNGYIPITVDIREDWEYRPSILINGIELLNPTIESEVKTIVVSKVRSNFVGDYDDIYKGQDVKSGSVTAEKVGKEDPVLFGTASQDVINKINSLNLGWSYESYSTGLTKQQRLLRTEPVGATYTNQESNDQCAFKLAAQLRPEITYDTQQIKVRYAEIGWDYVDTIFPVWSPACVEFVTQVEQSYKTRIPSVHIRNQFVHTEFDVHVNFIATAELIPEITESELEDPYFEEGDYVWDENTEGETDVDVVVTSPITDFIDNIVQFGLPILIIIIIIGVGLFILYKFGDKLFLIYALKKNR